MRWVVILTFLLFLATFFLVVLDLDLFLVAFLADALLVLAILKKDQYILPEW